MIALLHGETNSKVADAIASDLRNAFKGHVEISLNLALSPSPWPLDVSWDDLLIVLYDENRFPDAGSNFISEFIQKRGDRALVLPVALDPKHRTPPTTVSGIKGFPFDSTTLGVNGRLVKRVGAMLGFRVQKRDNQIFISYRATDGTEIAIQIEGHLAGLGYPVWRDEALELDGDTKILPGSKVQKQIDDALDKASIVLLLDTPAAPQSPWITHEVDTANSMLLPVLPVCLLKEDDHKKGPRFRSLLDLRRWVQLPFRIPQPSPPLTDVELNQIVDEMEGYLCELFQRKCRVPFLVEKEFVSRLYDWRMLDQRLLMCEAVKKHSERLSTRVLNHCSIFDQVHGPGLRKFSEFLKASGRSNHSLYIYDGELIPEPQLKEIIAAMSPDDGVVILHHQELSALVDSNFTTLTT